MGLAELVNARTELINVRAELVDVGAQPISCLVAIRSGNSSPKILIKTLWFEPRNANSETMKSNLEFGNSWFAFTLYVVWRVLQTILYQ